MSAEKVTPERSSPLAVWLPSAWRLRLHRVLLVSRTPWSMWKANITSSEVPSDPVEYFFDCNEVGPCLDFIVR